MNHLSQLAANAQIAAFVVASADAQEIDFLGLRPRMASQAERESLHARWPGRGLCVSGVIGRLPDGRTQFALNAPLGQIELAALLDAFEIYCEALSAKPQCDDSAAWCELLHALPDTRTEA